MDEAQKSWLQRLIGELEVVEIDGAVKQCAIALRRDYRLKLPDALKIDGMVVKNPFA